jgi:hypothetical protein
MRVKLFQIEEKSFGVINHFKLNVGKLQLRFELIAFRAVAIVFLWKYIWVTKFGWALNKSSQYFMIQYI